MRSFFNSKSALEKFGEKIFFLLVENFPHTYYVGGSVRNFLLKEKITDIDFATSAKPNQVVELLHAAGVSTNLRGEKYGVVKAGWDGGEIEIATFRKESYANSRYPKVSFIASAKEDSKRRDFTINALYFNPKTADLLDFHDGLQDIQHRQVRLIGQPFTKLTEDPLRIVRALRFALKLNLKIEAKTFETLKNNLSLLENISKTKVEKEILKLKNKKQESILKKVIHNPLALDKYFRKR